MSILLTGGAGYIGQAVLSRLIAGGHDVTALVRSPEKAAIVEAAGGTALVGLADDAQLVTQAARDADGVIHIASGPEVDAVLLPAVIEAIAGHDARLVTTGGIWIYGSGDELTEQSPFQPLPISGWREAGQALVTGAGGVVISPAVVVGGGAGILQSLVDAGKAADDDLVPLVGDGSQHWTTVHLDDLAELYVLAYENPAASGVYIAASGVNPTVAELGSAVASSWGLAGVREESVEDSRARLSANFADALLLDQQASGGRARAELGWSPSAPSVFEEIATGSYSPGTR